MEKPKVKKQPAKKKPGHPRQQKQPSQPKPRPSKPARPLPPPLESAPAAQPVSEPQPKSLIDGVRSLFSSPKPAEESSTDSSTFSTATFEPLSPETERILSAAPDVVSDQLPQADAQGADLSEENGVSALMAQVTFEEEDVREGLEMLFALFAEWRQIEDWKLTANQSRILGRPCAQMINAIWLKLQGRMPGWVERWLSETPGAAAFLLACAIVVGPKVSKDIAISRERRNADRAKPVSARRQNAAGPVAVGRATPASGPVSSGRGGVNYD